MSPNDQAAVKGQYLTKYVEARNELGVIEAKIKQMAAKLIEIGQAADGLAYYNADFDTEAADMPTPVAFLGLIKEARETREKRDQAQRELRRLGIDIQ
jgi:hypothetical protein